MILILLLQAIYISYLHCNRPFSPSFVISNFFSPSSSIAITICCGAPNLSHYFSIMIWWNLLMDPNLPRRNINEIKVRSLLSLLILSSYLGLGKIKTCSRRARLYLEWLVCEPLVMYEFLLSNALCLFFAFIQLS